MKIRPLVFVQAAVVDGAVVMVTVTVTVTVTVWRERGRCVEGVVVSIGDGYSDVSTFGCSTGLSSSTSSSIVSTSMSVTDTPSSSTLGSKSEDTTISEVSTGR